MARWALGAIGRSRYPEEMFSPLSRIAPLAVAAVLLSGCAAPEDDATLPGESDEDVGTQESALYATPRVCSGGFSVVVLNNGAKVRCLKGGVAGTMYRARTTCVFVNVGYTIVRGPWVKSDTYGTSFAACPAGWWVQGTTYVETSP